MGNGKSGTGKKEELRRRIAEEPDFIHSKKFENSLKLLLKKYPDGVPDRTAARVLMITMDELDEIYDSIIGKCRAKMGVCPE